MRPTTTRRRWWLLSLPVAAYLIICAYMFLVQRSMLFRPDVSDVSATVSALAGAQNITLRTTDGVQINAWWKPPAEGRPVYLYLHGNGANLTRRTGRFTRLTEDGSGLLAVSWRGYGGSEGAPSEAGLRLDGAAAYDWLAARVPADRIILFGESLGTGVAIWLASERPARLLALDSPYASIVALGEQLFPWLPVAWLSRDPFRSIDLAPRVRIPVVAQHCRDDWVIPLTEAERLMAAFPSGSDARRPDFTIIERRCHVPDVTASLLPRVRQALLP
jgi:uncharacterized protein